MASQPVDFVTGLGALPNPQAAIDDNFARRIGQERAGLQNQLLGAEVQQQQRKVADTERYQTRVAELLSNPSAQNYSAMFAEFPGFKDELNKSWETRDTAARQGDLSQLGQLHAALKGGRKDLAIKMLQSRIDADKEAGAADDQDQLYLDALMNDDPNDDATVLGMTGAAVAAITGPDQYAKTYDAIGADGQRKGQIVGRTIGHYDETGKFVTDYRDPEPAQYRTVSDGESLVEVQPGGAAPVAAPGGAAMGRSDVLARIEAIEGTGQNPLSSSVGVGQFTNATWLATFKKHGNAAGKSDAEILALRTNPNVARPMLAALVRDHEAKLTADGHPVTPGNIYLSHFLGQGGASKVLSADPSTPMTKLVTPGAIAANKSLLQGKTAGDVIAWTAQRMAGGGSGGSGGARVVATGAAKQKDPPSGYRWVGDALQPITGGPADASRKNAGVNGAPKLTEQQAKDGFGARRMANASKVLQKLESDKGFNANFAGVGSSITKYTGGLVNNSKSRQYQAAKGEWADALIRLTTGAAATKDEMASIDTTYFPQIGDDATVQKQKRQQRGVAMAGAIQRAGPGAPPSGPVKVRSIQEAMKLAPGTMFVDPRGVTRRR